jgi:hypothetical protein
MSTDPTRSAINERKRGALVLLALLAGIALVVEYLAGWGSGQVLASIFTFATVFVISWKRLSPQRLSVDPLWITRLWRWGLRKLNPQGGQARRVSIGPEVRMHRYDPAAEVDADAEFVESGHAESPDGRVAWTRTVRFWRRNDV